MIQRIILIAVLITFGSRFVAATEPSATSKLVAEDARLNVFFDTLFDRDITNSPNRQTSLGLKTER